MSESIDLNEEIPIVRDLSIQTMDANRTPPGCSQWISDPDERLPPARHASPPRLSTTFDSADQFSLMKTYLDEKFSQMEQQFETAHRDNQPPKQQVFQYKGKSNKIQGELNEEVLGSIKKAKVLINHGAVKRPSDLLTEVEEKLEKRIKLIRIADTSAGGWDTAERYQEPKVAVDAADAKRIREVDKEAIAAKKAKLPYTNYASRYQRYYTPRLPTTQQYSKYYQPSTASTGRMFRTAKPTDICLQCQGRGHWKRDCLAGESSVTG